ncbi:MAG: hypothetical protein ACRD51_08150 [Candidatus Acidiferrum sp.]
MSYNGKLRAVTRKVLYKDFAVSNDGSNLVLLQVTDPKLSAAQATIISLDTGASSPPIALSTTTGLAATCGTIVTIENKAALHRRVAITKDLLAGKNLSNGAYVDFRCSLDNHIVVGYSSIDAKSLIVRDGNERKTPLESLPNLLDISPDGRFVAFYTAPMGGSHLCIWDTTQMPSCLDHLDVADRISISNAGDVLFETDSGESCFFLDSEHYSKKPKPGYDTAYPCPDVAYWRRGMPQPEILQSLADNPQWLTDTAASRLATWTQTKF